MTAKSNKIDPTLSQEESSDTPTPEQAKALLDTLDKDQESIQAGVNFVAGKPNTQLDEEDTDDTHTPQGDSPLSANDDASATDTSRGSRRKPQDFRALAQKRRSRGEKLLQAQRDKSGVPTMPVPVVINTTVVYRFMMETWPAMNDTLSSITRVGPITVKWKATESLRQQINEKLTSLHSDISKDLEHAEIMINNLRVSNPGYLNPEWQPVYEGNMPAHDPLAVKFLNALVTFDRVMVALETLSWNMEVDGPEKNKILTLTKQRTQGAVGYTMRVYHEMVNSLRGIVGQTGSRAAITSEESSPSRVAEIAAAGA